MATTTIGPNPTLVRLIVPAPRLQRPGESRAAYITRAARYCRRKVAHLLETEPEYKHAHRSFVIRDAMLVTEKAFPDLGTFGVEYIAKGKNQRSPAIDYLNSGDTYTLTLLHVRGRFRVGCWGDIVERGNYE